jgi:hypothetical protein
VNLVDLLLENVSALKQCGIYHQVNDDVSAKQNPRQRMQSAKQKLASGGGMGRRDGSGAGHGAILSIC